MCSSGLAERLKVFVWGNTSPYHHKTSNSPEKMSLHLKDQLISWSLNSFLFQEEQVAFINLRWFGMHSKDPKEDLSCQCTIVSSSEPWTSRSPYFRYSTEWRSDSSLSAKRKDKSARALFPITPAASAAKDTYCMFSYWKHIREIFRSNYSLWKCGFPLLPFLIYVLSHFRP